MTDNRHLNEIEHKDVRVNTGYGIEYGDGLMCTLAIPSEFRSLVADYPIFLHKDEASGKFMPMVMFGFEQDENLFLDGDRWHADYVPLMMRRGPFLIGFQDGEPGISTRRKPVVVIDMDNPRVSKEKAKGGKDKQEELLFNPTGGNSAYTEQIIQTLQRIDEGQRASDEFCHALTQHDLIEPFSLKVRLNDGKQHQVTGFYTISEEKLAEIDPDVLKDFAHSGMLHAAHMILASMSNIPRLIRLKNEKNNADPLTVPAYPDSPKAESVEKASGEGPSVSESASGEVGQVAYEKPGVLPKNLLALGRPVILKDFVKHWTAVQAALQGNSDLIAYLRQLSAGKADKDVLVFKGLPGQKGRYFYNENLTGFNFERLTMSLGNWLDRMDRDGEPDEHLYVGSTTVDELLPGFNDQNPVDLGVPSALISLWMGNQSRIAAHFDAPENLVCVVSGHRRFTLFPPEQITNLYVGPLEFNPAGQPISLVDFANPDFDRFPRFRDALAAAQVVELEPGDALHIPAMWWHHVESLDSVNLMVNYWWKASEETSGSPMDALLHALLGIRGLPERQRIAWRNLFEHYVFEGDTVDFSHIPEHSLGWLGKLDAKTMQQMRTMLSNFLSR